jgi:hypothetical protein
VVSARIVVILSVDPRRIAHQLATIRAALGGNDLVEHDRAHLRRARAGMAVELFQKSKPFTLL